MKSIVTLSVLCTLPALGVWPKLGAAQESPSIPVVPCDGFNYWVTEAGDCVDLSYLSAPPPEAIETRFYRTLEKIGVKIIEETCPEQDAIINYGAYLPALNIMRICINNTKENPKAFLDTLVHESWHTVQDCNAGFNTNPVPIKPVIQGNTSLSQLVKNLGVSSVDEMQLHLTTTDRDEIRTLYSPGDFEIEVEARFLQNYPNEVLAALEVCTEI